MAHGSGATWKEWADAYDEVRNALPAVADVACPHCASRTLRTAFMAGRGQPLGVGFFWCDTCLFGIGLSGATIPLGAHPLPFGLAEEELREFIPNYTLVPPMYSDEFNVDG
jgi:hypothetical protein